MTEPQAGRSDDLTLTSWDRRSAASDDKRRFPARPHRFRRRAPTRGVRMTRFAASSGRLSKLRRTLTRSGTLGPVCVHESSLRYWPR